MVFVKEQKIGLYSEFVFNCDVCGKKEVMESENADTTLMGVNTAAVTAFVNSGQGFTQLEICCALLDLPNI